MNFVDTHSHFYAEEFSEDFSEALQKAKDSGVTKILLPNIDIDSLEPMFALSKSDDTFYPMLGLHPTSVDLDYEKQLLKIEEYFAEERICAIGEIGIDLYWDRTFLNEQIIVFERQIEWALERNLPMVIHTRKSFDEALASLKKFKADKRLDGGMFKGVFHCFGGDLNQARKVIEMGFKIGIGGVVTFKNAHLAEIVKEISIEGILLETDSPYLAPTPYRGQRNESSYIPIIAEKIAQIKNLSLEEVAYTTTKTATQLFNL